MYIKKTTTITFMNIKTMFSDNNALSLGQDLEHAVQTVNEQFARYATIDEKFSIDFKSRDQKVFNVVFTLTFTEHMLRLLKVKDYYLYELLEDYDVT